MLSAASSSEVCSDRLKDFLGADSAVGDGLGEPGLLGTGVSGGSRYNLSVESFRESLERLLSLGGRSFGGTSFGGGGGGGGEVTCCTPTTAGVALGGVRGRSVGSWGCVALVAGLSDVNESAAVCDESLSTPSAGAGVGLDSRADPFD